MTLLYTIDWKRIKCVGNVITLLVKCLDESGKIVHVKKDYREWLGICTDDIRSIVSKIKFFFPGIELRYEKIDNRLYAKVLPYFKDRLKTDNLNYKTDFFYKVYTDCCIEDLGTFFKHYDIAYFNKSDWLVRLYIDLSARYQTQNGFFYRWYDVDFENPNLIDAFRMKTDFNALPRWKVAAFDIETVSTTTCDENRIPNGIHPSDKIVMISIVKWQADEKKEFILYLNPLATHEEIKKHIKDSHNNKRKYLEYRSEELLLNDFHFLIKDCHVITGYNINKYDIPCIFARLLWLGKYNILNQYSSSKIGEGIVTTFQDKIVIDVYHYFHTFSNYDLSSFKLDDVARMKLGSDVGKISVDAVGINYWYRRSEDISLELCLSSDRQYCYDVLKPAATIAVEKFGTFLEYLEYCLRDSQLVYQLFSKEMILGFLMARANFGGLNVIQALHYGNSRILLEILKTYGTLLGFFLNTEFLNNQSDSSKYASTFIEDSGTYQGALNYCLKEQYFEDVVVLDFMSMYPMALLSANLCYGTCDILSTQEYEAITVSSKKDLTIIPYRIHGDSDFQNKDIFSSLSYPAAAAATDDDDDNNKQLDFYFKYPSYDPETDPFVIVINQRTKAFLPTLVQHFIVTRQYHQRRWKETKDVFHYNSQLCIKILINSLYGIMASKDSPLAYVPIAMAIVNLARYQLLGSYHYVEKMGYTVCYADTDSLMVHRWPFDHCDRVNRFLNMDHVELKFEHRMKRLLILSKKRYIYELGKDFDDNGMQIIRSKGFQKKINDLVKYMSRKIISAVMNLNGTDGDPSDGWILWVETLCEAFFMCRDPKKYSITRKTKKMSDYISKTCPAVKMLKKYPEKQGGYIDYVYSRADVSAKQFSSWIMDANDCQYVNFEQLFMSQKKILETLLTIGYWKNCKNPSYHCDMVLNTMRWKCFLNAELKHGMMRWKCFLDGELKHGFKENAEIKELMETYTKIFMMVEKGVKYTFKINDTFSNNGRKSVVVKKRKIDIFHEGRDPMKNKMLKTK